MPGVIEIVDRLGRRRRAKPHEVLADGESFSMQMQFLDEQVHDHLVAKFDRRTVVDGSGTKAGHRPGFLFCDQASDDAAAVAYDERSKRMQSAWRRGNEPDEPDESDAPGPSPTLNQVPEERRSLVAYEARKKRLQNGWKHR